MKLLHDSTTNTKIFEVDSFFYKKYRDIFEETIHNHYDIEKLYITRTYTITNNKEEIFWNVKYNNTHNFARNLTDKAKKLLESLYTNYQRKEKLERILNA